MSSDRPIDRILTHLEGVEDHGDHYEAKCPAHDDKDPSLHLKEAGENGSRKVLVHCFVCKDQEKVLRALEERGIHKSDLFSQNGEVPGNRNGNTKAKKRRMCLTKVYDYKSPDGKFVKHHTLRFAPPPEGEAHHPNCLGDHCNSRRKDKDFLQARPNDNGGYVYGLNGTETVLYNLPDVMRASLRGETIVWVEGEKDADNGKKRLGLTTTTCPQGAKHWRPHYAGLLAGAHVVVVADNDGPGRKHAEMVARELLPLAASVKVLKLPGLDDGDDLTNWTDLGRTRKEFDVLVENTPLFDSGHIGEEFGRNELLPVKSVSEVLAESGEGPEWKVGSLVARGNITDLSGEAKLSGKTTFTMHMIASVVKGEDFMGFPTEKSKVLYLTEQGNNFAEALQKAGLEGADGELFVIQHKDVRGVEWKELLTKAVEECNRRGLGVLVVDTFAAFSGIVGAEENNSGDIRDKMAPLKEAAQEHELAVLYVRHAGKSGRARGSSQFEAEGDIILTLKRPEGNHAENVRVLEGIGRYDEIPRKLNIELTHEGYVALGSDGQVQFGKAVEIIKQRLPHTRESAISQDELLEKIKDGGVSKKTMQRALDWLVEDGRGEIRREGEGVKGDPYRYWMPSEDPPFPPVPDDEIHSGQTPSPNGRNEYTNDNRGGAAHSQEPTEPPQTRGQGQHGAKGEVEGAFITDSEYIVGHVVPALERCSDVSLDIETTDLSPFKGEVRVLSLHADGKTHLIDCSVADPSPALEAIKDKILYIHGAEFDLPFLYHAYGFAPTKTPIDTLHLSQVVRAGEWIAEEDGRWQRIRHSLEEGLPRELGVELGNKKKYQRGEAWKGNLTEEHADYAANDVIHLKSFAQKLFALLEERGLGEIWKLEQRAKPLFLEMCRQGISFDKDRWDGLVAELEDSVLELKERADALAPPHPEGETWNWFSKKQAKEAFKLTGLNVPNLKRETLSRYKNSLVKAVSEYRDAKNELSRVRTWYEGRYKDGRVYPQWNPCGAATGRASCTSPNVQSLTKDGGYRSCIRP